ncbi:hypothetical protein Emag_002200 [Eimeria magna]
MDERRPCPPSAAKWTPPLSREQSLMARARPNEAFAAASPHSGSSSSSNSTTSTSNSSSTSVGTRCLLVPVHHSADTPLALLLWMVWGGGPAGWWRGELARHLNNGEGAGS